MDLWFRWIKIRPVDAGHFINGFNLSGNVFKVLGSPIDRVEEVDTTFSVLDETKTQEFTMVNNSFTNVNFPAANPIKALVSSMSASAQWTGDFTNKLPFGLWAMNVTSVCSKGPILTSSSATHYNVPYAESEQGVKQDQVHLNWAVPVRGDVICTVHADQIDSA